VHAVVLFCAVLSVRLRTKFLSLCGELCTLCVLCTVYEGAWHAALRCVRCLYGYAHGKSVRLVYSVCSAL
jgi:hypothetical protein